MAEQFKNITSGSVVFEGRGGNALVFNNDGDILLTNGLATITPNDDAFVSLNKNENQIVLSAGVLKINARETDIYLNSKKYISLSAGESVHIDVGPINTDNEANKFLVNAPRIEFTTVGKGRKLVPVARANELVDVLNELMNAIYTYSKFVAPASKLPPVANLGVSNLQLEFQNIASKLNDIKSDLTYTQ